MSNAPVILWFRQDLRLADHPAVRHAADSDSPVIPVFIHAPDEEGPWAPGGAARWWQHHALNDLAAQLSDKGSRLVIRGGDSLEVLRSLVEETGAETVLWGRRYEPAMIARDSHIQQALQQDGLTARSYNAALLFEPHEIATKQGKPYQVYTPFWRACMAAEEPTQPYAEPRQLKAPRSWPDSDAVDDLGLLPDIRWDEGIAAAWNPTRQGAEEALHGFLADAVTRYDEGRNLPSDRGTSRLSPYLHHGQLGPREVWDALEEARARHTGRGADASGETFAKELVWREFAHHLLVHFPHTPTQPLRQAFEDFPWRDAPEDLQRWQQGQTGYPLVDAGMRELWQTGWMHNRVRMIVASFLVKHLRIHWLQGARWFWDTLVDADLAANTLGWQWTAGCGADASPYFRVFNPITQGGKFDAHEYVRTYVPEVAHLPDKQLFSPWEASVELWDRREDQRYPGPIVDHPEARKAALAAYETIKKA